MLHVNTFDSISSCSKAPRGLLVLVRTDGIFTANALSPSPLLRQCPYRYAIRAGRNLPDKEFRYLRNGYSYRRRSPGLQFRPLSPPLNLPAPGRRQPLYIHFRVGRDLCFR